MDARPTSPIANAFSTCRKRKQIALMPFIPAGFPDLETTAQTLVAAADAGASIIEVGIPFSDPIADGPVIQAAFTAALSRGLKLTDIFRTIGQVRASVSAPLVAMVSYSVVFRYGLARFLTNAKMSGFDGLIIPDLPPPEAQRICQQVRAAGLDTILLVAPSTSAERRAEIVALCSGFVYYLSVAGITGERDGLPADMRANVESLKRLGPVPVCVGFGVHKAEQVRQISDFADGAIIGTAVVRRMQQHLENGPGAIAAAVGDYVRELLGPSR